MKCRHCEQALQHQFLDLASAPPSNAYLTAQTLQQAETWLPLKIMVCQHCWLVQTEDFTGRENLFDADYAYFSSCSSSWLAHAQQYVQQAIERFSLNADSMVVEVAANDGYLLQYVAQAGIPCYGIEPTASTAAAARAKGLTIEQAFFGTGFARQLQAEGRSADLMAANNVLAHVPDINDFVAGFYQLLKPQGVASFEFPHLQNMIRFNQFDTAYHEHYSYLSLTAVHGIMAAAGLQVFDVEQLSSHGGSLRVWVQRADSGRQPVLPAVEAILVQEAEFGISSLATYAGAQQAARQAKFELLRFLLDCQSRQLKVVAYGAAAKGNTLLNFAGVKADLLPYVADISPHKQNKFMPGSRIPIISPEQLLEQRPDFVLILPWNLRREISSQLAAIRSWGGRFVVAIPELEVW